MNQAKYMLPIIENTFRVLGWELNAVNIKYEPDLGLNPERRHEVEILTKERGTWSCDVYCEMRPFTMRSITGEVEVMRGEWVLVTTVMKDGGYWDPPYEDEIELAADPSLHKAIVDAVLSNIRAEMYDSFSYTPDIEEDVPQ